MNDEKNQDLEEKDQMEDGDSCGGHCCHCCGCGSDEIVEEDENQE